MAISADGADVTRCFTVQQNAISPSTRGRVVHLRWADIGLRELLLKARHAVYIRLRVRLPDHLKVGLLQSRAEGPSHEVVKASVTVSAIVDFFG